MSEGPLPPPRARALAVPALIALLCLVWGSTWWAIRVALLDQPPLTSAALRFLLAGAAMASAVPLLRRVDRLPAPPRWLWVATGATSFAGSYGVLYVAEQTVPSGVAAVLWAVFPLLMAASGVLVLGERLAPTQRLGFVVSFAGIVVVFANGLGGAATAAAALLLVSPVVSAIGTTLVKRFGKGTSSVLLNRNAMLFGAALLALAAVLREDPFAMVWSWRGVLATGYLAVVGTACTFGVYFWLLQRVPASRLSLISYVTPVLAVLLGALVGDGELTAALVLGTLLVVAGIALVVQKDERPLRAWTPRSARGRRRAAAGLAVLLLALLWATRGGGERRTWPRDRILAAIRFVESSDRDDVPDGDGGKAIGPYQIHEVYWQDAVRAEPALGGRYADCRQRAYAEDVVAAYMRKWVPDAWARGDAETIARVHNGGPGGAAKDATRGYWERVRARLP
jgi:drug/metabolite transporter (DMT)-like permease